MIDVVDADGIRTITLSNPAKRNALDRATLDALCAAVAGVVLRDPDANVAGTSQAAPAASVTTSTVRAIVLRGDPAGGAFSSGFDIGAIDDDERERGLDPIDAPASAIEASTVPVIAAIDGACMGGAFEIAMACTMRVCARGAKLAMPPARLGLVYSASGLARFLRAASPSRVQRMFLTGERVSADDALAWGLVDAVVDDADGEVARIAGLIANNAPLAVAGMLDAIRRLGEHPVHDAARAAIDAARARAIASEDLVEGVRAFIEKRAPSFKGR